jgi:membrane protease YdiL (CAAX protease family)
VRIIPHPVVLQQITAPQPRLWITFLCLFVPNWLPTSLAHALMLWPVLSTFASEHDAGYRVTFFLVQLSLICGAVVFASRSHTAAAWTPQPSWGRGIAISVLTLLPLFLYHLSSSVQGIQATIALSSFGGEARETLSSIHDETWGRLAYGSSLAGVVCSSVMSFTAPVLEELVFTGFVLNATAKQYGFVVAVVSTSACFALVHVFQFGVGQHLALLFFAGLTYAGIRVLSGSLLLAVFGHCTINVVIFLPKWAIAVLHFSRN